MLDRAFPGSHCQSQLLLCLQAVPLVCYSQARPMLQHLPKDLLELVLLQAVCAEGTGTLRAVLLASKACSAAFLLLEQRGNRSSHWLLSAGHSPSVIVHPEKELPAQRTATV